MKILGFFDKLKIGLSKTRNNFTEKIDNLFKFAKKIDEETLEELEELLIMADVGVEVTQRLMERLRERIKDENLKEADEVKKALKDEMKQFFPKTRMDLKPPSIILVVGVNGVGKTTSIGKLAHLLKQQDYKVILAAGDTFRAAAAEQLEIWGQRVGVDVIKHQEGSDPASVLFDTLQAGKARKADVIICDTAGRLHTKKNLMEELKKLYRVCQKEYPEAQIISLLVIDATTGQNALNQAKLFKETVEISGVVITKLDGTAKGGIAIAVAGQLDIPIWFIGIGESINDLHEFDSDVFVDAIL
ncbi:MAG TPA: signal recognition particle-docking protein FtsY [Thermoanaerobacterales bacterium]|nr:signal recognition particle-docking protein FtsY [Thermoanaerobacterales bacterium]